MTAIKWLVLASLTFILPQAKQQPTPTFPPPPDLILLDSVDARFDASNTVPLVGEPVELTLEARFPTDVTIVEWPEIESDWGDIEVSDVQPIASGVDFDQTMIQQQTMTIRVWRSGDFSTPELFVGYRLPNDDTIYRVPVRATFFTVPTVLETTDLNVVELLPDRQPIGFFIIPWWVVILLLGMFGVGSYSVYRWWVRYEEAQRAKRAQTVAAPAWEQAIDRLNSINTQDVQALAMVEHTIRDYLVERFGISAHEMTTSETIQSLDTNGYLNAAQADDLGILLERADLVKFARAQGDIRTNERAIRFAIRWIQQTIPAYD